MTKVVLAGAGGKMGVRLTQNLKNSDYEMSYLEISPQGMQRLGEKGVIVSNAVDCIPGADIVILAVPDVALSIVSREMIPRCEAVLLS